MTVLEVCEQIQAEQEAQTLQLQAQTIALAAVQSTLQLILSAVAGPAEPAVVAGTVLTLSKGAALMTAKRAVRSALDFQLLDNGTAVATVSFVDTLGEPTTLSSVSTATTAFTSSDPEVSVTANPDGLTAVIAAVVSPGQPLSTGVTITAVTTITNSDGSTAPGPFTSTDQVDVVAGGPAGTSIAIS